MCVSPLRVGVLPSEATSRWKVDLLSSVLSGDSAFGLRGLIVSFVTMMVMLEFGSCCEVRLLRGRFLRSS